MRSSPLQWPLSPSTNAAVQGLRTQRLGNFENIKETVHRTTQREAITSIVTAGLNRVKSIAVDSPTRTEGRILPHCLVPLAPGLPLSLASKQTFVNLGLSYFCRPGSN